MSSFHNFSFRSDLNNTTSHTTNMDDNTPISDSIPRYPLIENNQNHNQNQNQNQNQNHNQKQSRHHHHHHRDNTNHSTKTEKELFQILNSEKPALSTNFNNSNPILNTNITDEDVAFLKAASEVVKLHENKVDPTIRDILNRLQYSNSPHGGLPISMQYLKSIDTFNDIDDNNNNNNNDENTTSNDLGDRLALLSTNDSNDHLTYSTNTINNNTNDGLVINNGLNILPPFTENRLRNPPTNLDFPHFSLDIFKNHEDDDNNSNFHLNNSPNQHLNTNLLHRSDINDNDHEIHYNQQEQQAISLEENNLHSSNQIENKEASISIQNNASPRNYKCGECGISFKRSSDLKRHEKIHLKTLPNICPLCHKGFARRDALKRHVGTLTCNRNRMRLLKQLEENGESLETNT